MTRYYRLPTPWGDLLAWSNRRGNVGVRTEWAHNRYPHTGPAGGWEGMPEVVTFGTTEYAVHDSMTLTESGELTHYDEGLRRRLESNRWNDPAAPSHVRKFREGIEAAVLAWLDTDDGRESQHAGELEDIERLEGYARRDLEEIETQAAAKRADLEELAQRRAREETRTA